MTEILFLLTLLSGKSMTVNMPGPGSLNAVIEGRNEAIQFQEISKLEPVRDSAGNLTWPVTGHLLAKLTFTDRSQSILAVSNIRFPSVGLGGELLLSDMKSMERSGTDGVAASSMDIAALRDNKRLEGELLNQVFEVRIFYPAAWDPPLLRFTRDQLSRIEFGDLPLEAGPEKAKSAVRPRFDRVLLRNGDRITGELQGPGLDFKLPAAAEGSASPAAEEKSTGRTAAEPVRRLIPLADLKSIDFALRPPVIR